MRKLIPLLILLLCGSIVSLKAQSTRLQEREAEWKSYSLPQTTFTRYVTGEKNLIFRVPADWKKTGPELFSFTGPNEARVLVATQTVPDGYPLTEYVASFLKDVGSVTTSAESVLTRRTQFQDLEAREIFFDAQYPDGRMFRSTNWITISGPLVVTVNLLAPIEHATAVEPFFKAIVQSVMFVPANFAEFEITRSLAIRVSAPRPIHEVANIVASLNELNSNREAAINRLTPLFVSQPESVADLLIDRRAIVRSAAAEALARSKNAALKSLLWHILDDSDPFVGEAAARGLAQEIDISAQLLNRSWIKNAAARYVRVWPFMSKDNRVKFMQGLLSQTTPDRTTQIGGLTLLAGMPPDDFKLPIARIVASNHDPLTIVALQVANHRGEQLPVDTLMKLAASPNDEIRKRAVENLGWSAAVSDIPKIEVLLSKPSASVYFNDKIAAAAQKAFEEETRLTIKKIRFRNELGLAKDKEHVREIILKASSDAALDDFAWRYDCELTPAGCSPAPASRNPPDFKIKSLAENLLPKKVTHYTAIPNPGQALQRLHQTLHGLQLESPRAQANLIWVMGKLREDLGQQFGAPPDAAAVIDYTGIKADSPIVLGTWSAAGAPDSVALAQRSAIILRVNDRERFERLVERFQHSVGLFMYLTDYVALGTRAAAALPAFLPFVAQAILSADVDKPESVNQLSFSLVGQTEWNGIPIKSIEHRYLNEKWQFSGAATYVTFIGDVAILTRDVATVRDLLSNVTTAEHQLLSGNEEFRRSVATDGDIVYFSDLKAVFADPNDKSLGDVKKASESGALKFSNSSWENSHRFDFDESEWSKPLLPFHPKDLSAPRELLPSSTLAYYVMKLDLATAWQTWPKTMNLRENRFEIDPSFWSLDFTKEILPELGPECGAVLLELPDFNAEEIGDGAWAAFCKLKSNKLADALAAGKLFRNVGPRPGVAQIKSGETSYFVGVKNGFFVVSNSAKGLAAMADGKTNLAATRDYSRAAGKVPANIVAFGGYNLEAAVAAASATAGDGLRAQIAGMIFSIASAFHSQSFFATASAGMIEGRSSVAMDREGRYAVADFAYLPRGVNITYATLEPHGLPIFNQTRLSDIVLKVRAKAPGPIDSIKNDIQSATQTVEQKSPNELVLTVAARRRGADKKIQLPVTIPDLAAFLKPTAEITSDNPMVIDQAEQIAGDDRDAWSVAQKLADWTHKNLQWKSVARAGAADTLATREADCSEFSQLYVSMARSLGLPARIVSGLAYSGNSFGGHAWVEVWVGEWVELDPTWGTDFVDATHIRNESTTLVTAAALNLIDLEVMETRRTVAEFQKSPKALAEHLAKVIALGDQSEIEAAFDLATLTDEFMGAGAWTKLNDHERDQISSAYRRLLQEIISSYGRAELPGNLHVLNVEEKGERAEALCYMSMEDFLLRLRLLRRGEVWYFVDLVQPDPEIHFAVEVFGPVIKSIEAARSGKKTAPGHVSQLMKVVSLIDNQAGAKALEEAERLLQTNPNDQTYRFLKMITLWEMGEEKEEESLRLLEELSYEHPPFAPALYRLAGLLSEEKPEEAIELYKRYSALEPHDPRAYRDIASVYETMKQNDLAEAAYRKAIAVDPFEIPGYRDLAIFLIRNERVAEVGPVLLASDKYAGQYDDLLAQVLSDLQEEIKLKDAMLLAAHEWRRMKTSLWANLHLADIYVREKRYGEGLAIMKQAAQMDPTAAYPHVAMSLTYLKQSRPYEALKAADRALKINDKYGWACYLRASALARLGRKRDAMTALHKSIELDPDVLMYITEDEDLKSLRSLPAFQKLLREAEKQRAEADPK